LAALQRYPYDELGPTEEPREEFRRAAQAIEDANSLTIRLDTDLSDATWKDDLLTKMSGLDEPILHHWYATFGADGKKLTHSGQGSFRAYKFTGADMVEFIEDDLKYLRGGSPIAYVEVRLHLVVKAAHLAAQVV
jgi:hypothetical protein